MRKASPGVICVLLGVVLLLAALGLYGYNRWEDAQAGAEAQTVVQDLQEKVVEQTQSAASAPAIDTSSLDPELPVVELDGYEYVGTVSIPAIGIDLPVMSEWSYPVSAIEVHDPTDVEAVEHSGHDLVLYTCTYGGKTRIVVFCDRSN